MKFSFFSGFGYAPRQKQPDWPLPPHLHVQENVQAGISRAFGLFDLADELGFDWLATPEHHFKPYLSSNALLTAAVLTQRNYRARIAVLGTIVPGRDPVSLAEDIATLDQFAAGKLVVALLRGNPVEQLTFAVNPKERHARFEEAVELILTAWESGDAFGWEGRYYRRNPVGVWPKPFNGVRPETIVPVSTPEGAAFAARLKLSIGLGHIAVAEAAGLTAIYRREAESHGWTPRPDNIVYHCEIHIAETDSQSEDEIREFRLGILPDPLGADSDAGRRIRAALGEREDGHFAGGFKVLRFSGGPDTVARQIDKAAKAIGFGVINLIFQGGRLPGTKGRDSVALFAREVIPRFR